MADALTWIMKQRGVSHVDHYIDDFITLGGPGSQECETNMQIMLGTCEDTGTPIKTVKSEGPCTRLTFLGIELYSVAMEVRLPNVKLARLRESLAMWRRKKACKKRDLLSIIGSLSHACKVVKHGGSFLRRLAPSTQRTYDSAKRRFLAFCEQAHCSPLPVNEQLLGRYISHLASQGLSPKSIKSYLSAVRHLQIAWHLHDPKISEMPRLEQVIKGIKKEYAKHCPGQGVRLPITPEILLKMNQV